MAAIKNERDLLLQMDSPRFTIIPINIGDITGLTTALDTVTNTANTALTTAKGIRIIASAASFSRITGSSTTTPASITLTAELNGLTGSVAWSVVSGSASLSPSGNTCMITGSTVSGYSVTVKATLSGYTAQYTLTKLGALSALDTVNLTNQVTGQLATGNITGLGALALLNTVNLNTQVTGALNGATQVTNLGVLAYADGLAANQIGAGTLAAGVIYAGTINADNITSGSLVGRTIKTANSGIRFEVLPSGQILGYNSSNQPTYSLAGNGTLVLNNYGLSNTVTINSGGTVHIALSAHNSFPGVYGGGLFRHSVHELCYSDGVHWYKVSGTLIE